MYLNIALHDIVWDNYGESLIKKLRLLAVA